jgi:SAM-dependent methyltransferase
VTYHDAPMSPEAQTTAPPAIASPTPEEDLWDLRNLAEATRLCDFMVEQFPARIGRSAVEVGAGIGTFSQRLLDRGVDDLLLIEPEAICVSELEERFGGDPRVQVRAELLPEAPSLAKRPASFDFALSQNVFEHIEDDHGAVAAMARALKPGGVLMALVPAHPRLYGPLDRAYGHFRRYTPERLRSIVEAAGLEVERLYRFNALGTLGWWAKNRREASDIGSSPLKVYEALLAAWAPIERRIDVPVGLSLIVHARRPGGAPDA